MAVLFDKVTVVTMDEKDTVLKDAYVLVDGGKITYVGTETPKDFQGERIGGARKVLMPGLVNMHTHVPMTVLRGFADGYELHTWLNEHIFPAEAKFDASLVETSTNLGLAEMIASGTVAINEMYDFADTICGCVDKAGINMNITRATTLFDGAFDPKTHKGAREAVELYEKWHGHDDGRIRVDMGIHAEYTSSPPLWEWTAGFAKDHGLGLHIHVSETQKEHEECIARHGLTPIKALAKYGLLDRPLAAAHCVWISDTDMTLMQERGATAVHNPVSNMTLASGFARLTDIMAAGVNVALGTDSVASNNSHDMFEEIKAAAMIHKGAMRNPVVITAEEALRMATANGAKAQGRGDRSGQVKVGFDADLIMLDFDKPHLQPCWSATSNIVFAARGSDVVMNMVRGEIIYKNGEHLRIDVEKTIAEIGPALDKIRR
ncbi:amidohydrolase [Oscillospiraceae bacterium OttesenSCG-928-F05]|nr:amidohydrolase [Oscillospiraceae bacterium OttesenSCG-928-F05]